MRIRTAFLIVLSLTSLLLLGACGGDSESTSSTTNRSVEGYPQPDDSVQVLAPEKFQQYIADHPDAPVVNVHVPYEGHIEGTDAFVPFDEIADWSDLPEDLDAPIILYCRTGNMSADASTTLAAIGYTNITDLEGGMVAWSNAGLPLLDEEPAAD